MKENVGPRPRLSRRRAGELIERLSATRIAVLGDVMLDRYFWGDVDRISPEAPVPVVRVRRRSARLGGAANVAANLRALGATVEIAGVVGDDRAGDELRHLLGALELGGDGMVVERGRETTEKVRIIARSQQVVRADFEEERDAGDASRARLVEALGDALARCNGLVISDYGKGVTGESLLREIVPAWRSAGKVVVVDPHVPHFKWYRGASAVTPNTREATMATGLEFRAGESPSRGAFEVVRDMGLDAFLVTRGEEGMSLYPASGDEVHVSTVAKEVYDVTGAGDTVIAALTAAVTAGANWVEGMVLANHAAGEVVKDVGTAVVNRDALLGTFADDA